MNIHCQGTPEKTQCTNLATHHAGWLNKNLCPECLHYYAEDASPDEQASVEDLRPEPCFMPEDKEVDFIGAIFGGHSHSDDAPTLDLTLRRSLIDHNQLWDHEHPLGVANVENVLRKLTAIPETHGGWLAIQPERPFKCRYMLVWCHPDTVIHQVTVGNIMNLMETLPGIALTPVDPRDNSVIPFEAIETWHKEQDLTMMLQALHFPQIEFNVCDVQHRFSIQYEGELECIALFGQELISPNQKPTNNVKTVGRRE